MKNSYGGFIIPVIIVVVVALTGGGLFFYKQDISDLLGDMKKNNQPTTVDEDILIDSENIDQTSPTISQILTETDTKKTYKTIDESVEVESTLTSKTKTESIPAPVVKVTPPAVINSIGSIKTQFKTEGTTLCNIPRNISGYILTNAYVTNEPSHSTHTLYWNTSNGGLYTINPREKLLLIYKKDEQKINASLYRFDTFADMFEAFGPILHLQNEASVQTLEVNGAVKGQVKTIYVSNNSLLEVEGSNKLDSAYIINSITEACMNSPVYKTDTPKGFSAWRTTDLYTSEKAEFSKISDSNIILSLNSKYFGINPSIQTGSTYGSIIDGNVFLRLIYSVDAKGKLNPMGEIDMYAFKNSYKPEFIEFLKTNKMFLGYLVGDIKFLSLESSQYYGNKNVSVEHIIVHNSEKTTSSLSLDTHAYFVTKNNTTFVFASDLKDQAIIQSLIDNLKFE